MNRGVDIPIVQKSYHILHSYWLWCFPHFGKKKKEKIKAFIFHIRCFLVHEQILPTFLTNFLHQLKQNPDEKNKISDVLIFFPMQNLFNLLKYTSQCHLSKQQKLACEARRLPASVGLLGSKNSHYLLDLWATWTLLREALQKALEDQLYLAPFSRAA